MRAAQTRPSPCGQVETAAARAFVWIDCFGRELSATAFVRATATAALLSFAAAVRMAATGRHSPFTVCCRVQVQGRPADGTWTRRQAAGAVRATVLWGYST